MNQPLHCARISFVAAVPSKSLCSCRKWLTNITINTTDMIPGITACLRTLTLLHYWCTYSTRNDFSRLPVAAVGSDRSEPTSTCPRHRQRNCSASTSNPRACLLTRWEGTQFLALYSNAVVQSTCSLHKIEMSHTLGNEESF